MKNDKNENRNYYIQIADWMLDFNLPTNLLLTYAIVYGYNQTGNNCYWGSAKTMASLLGINSSGHATEYLNELEQRHLLCKEEVKIPNKQKMCKYYVTTDWEGKVEEQNVDYLTIQPWMFKKYNLRNNLLLIFARIQNFSRSRNYYFYNCDDLARWANCDSSRIRNYIKQLINGGYIEKIDLINDEGYRSIDFNKWSTSSNSGVPFDSNSKSGVEISKSGNNNLTTLESTDTLLYIIKQNEISSYFNIEAFQKNEDVQYEMLRELEANKYSDETLNKIRKSLMLITKTVDAYNYANIRKINKLSSKQYKELYSLAYELVDDKNAITPEKIIASKISKYIKNNRKEEKE